MKILYTYLVFAFVASFAFSCKSTESTTNKEEIPVKETASKENMENDSPEQEEIQTMEDSLFASIERGACFGNCPTYKMYIYMDGSVKLEGKRAIELIGNYTTTITKEQMNEFIAMADSIEYMSLDDEYDGPITDIPGTLTTIVIDGKKKSVYRRYQYPKRILKFEQLFDDLIKSEDWEKVEEADH